MFGFVKKLINKEMKTNDSGETMLSTCNKEESVDDSVFLEPKEKDIISLIYKKKCKLNKNKHLCIQCGEELSEKKSAKLGELKYIHCDKCNKVNKIIEVDAME